MFGFFLSINAGPLNPRKNFPPFWEITEIMTDRPTDRQNDRRTNRVIGADTLPIQNKTSPRSLNQKLTDNNKK